MTGRGTPAPEYRDIPQWATRYDASEFDSFSWTADVLAFALDGARTSLRALVVVRGGEPFRGLDAWPGGFVDARSDADAHATAIRELREETGREAIDYMEELGTYGRQGRDPRQFAGFWDAGAGRWVERGTRVVSTAQLGLVRTQEGEAPPAAGDDADDARWADVYDYLPWEDLRGVRGRAAFDRARKALARWAAEGPPVRAERVERAFGVEGGRWNEELVPNRYRLLREAGLVEEARRDRWGRVASDGPDGAAFGTAMAFDHREMLADALGRLRGKQKYVPRVLQALVGDRFTLDELQDACEAVAGRPLHRANFRRLVRSVRSPLVVPTGDTRESPGPGVDPKLHAFRGEVVAARLDVALRMPWAALTSVG
ncbi:MAG: hypothetical protein JWM27_681 [Gemmatimonadetes bacterium]|nr:hypothetical protein [Gemmatimonadota bacterium]